MAQGQAFRKRQGLGKTNRHKEVEKKKSRAALDYPSDGLGGSRNSQSTNIVSDQAEGIKGRPAPSKGQGGENDQGQGERKGVGLAFETCGIASLAHGVLGIK